MKKDLVQPIKCDRTGFGSAMELGVIMSKKVGTTFYLKDEIVTVLKIKVVAKIFRCCR